MLEKRVHTVASVVCAMALTGCAFTTTSQYTAAGDGFLCDPSERSLGIVAVLPETA